MPYVITEELYASIDGVPLDTPAWSHANRMELWDPAARRGGEGTIIPLDPGRIANPARADETERSIRLDVENHLDWEGNPHTDLRYGWIRNIGHLKDEIVADPGGDGTRLLLLELGDEGTWSAEVVVTGMESDEVSGAAVITIRVNEGELMLSGS
jgi:hypothetical protein